MAQADDVLLNGRKRDIGGLRRSSFLIRVVRINEGGTTAGYRDPLRWSWGLDGPPG